MADDKPPFDVTKWMFFLIAGILAFQCLVVLMALLFCMWHGESIIEGKWSCANTADRISELITGALAAALAFAGGYGNKDRK